MTRLRITSMLIIAFHPKSHSNPFLNDSLIYLILNIFACKWPLTNLVIPPSGPLSWAVLNVQERGLLTSSYGFAFAFKVWISKFAFQSCFFCEDFGIHLKMKFKQAWERRLVQWHTKGVEIIIWIIIQIIIWKKVRCDIRG